MGVGSCWLLFLKVRCWVFVIRIFDRKFGLWLRSCSLIIFLVCGVLGLGGLGCGVEKVFEVWRWVIVMVEGVKGYILGGIGLEGRDNRGLEEVRVLGCLDLG